MRVHLIQNQISLHINLQSAHACSSIAHVECDVTLSKAEYLLLFARCRAQGASRAHAPSTMPTCGACVRASARKITTRFIRENANIAATAARGRDWNAHMICACVRIANRRLATVHLGAGVVAAVRVCLLFGKSKQALSIASYFDARRRRSLPPISSRRHEVCKQTCSALIFQK